MGVLVHGVSVSDVGRELGWYWWFCSRHTTSHVFLEDVCVWRVYPLVVLLLCLHTVEVKLPIEGEGVFVVYLNVAT